MKNIIILGGGSSGWMTAAYINAKLPEINITLIESPKIPTIGVGESMTLYLMKFLDAIGIKEESEWMPKCNATLKNGVLYKDWNYIGSKFWHTFEVDEGNFPYWNIEREKNNLKNEDYWKDILYSGRAGIEDSNKWLSDKDGNVLEYYHSKSFNGWPQIWSYHIDANLFGEYIKELTVDDVTHIVDEVVDVELDASGVSKIIGESGEEYTADLFIDCTGFKRALISEFDTEAEFTTLDPYLTHDKVIAMPTPYIDKDKEMKPRTKATALSSGWSWEVPLYNRMGTGYCYTSKYISDEEAEKELREHIGVDRVKDVKSFVVDVKTGYYKKPFTKNVLAIGLSAGFIEPLEATILFLSQLSGMRLVDIINGQLSADNFNSEIEMMMVDFIDHISTQYYMSHRDDSEFWRAQKNTHISKRMKEWISSCDDKLQQPKERLAFGESSWISKLIGYELYPKESTFEGFTEEGSKKAKMHMAKIKDWDYDGRISQKEYLDKFIYKV